MSLLVLSRTSQSNKTERGPLSVPVALQINGNEIGLGSGGSDNAGSWTRADPWKDESGKGRWGGGYDRGHFRSYNCDREYKQEYHQGKCKIERKQERNSQYKEETKCKGYG